MQRIKDVAQIIAVGATAVGSAQGVELRAVPNSL
jgi:hypothetical protein